MTAATDPYGPRVALGIEGLLGAFNAAGVLAAADVHVARRLGRLLGDADEDVLLAVALAVRAPRLGHVFVDLAAIAQTVTVDSDDAGDPAALPWPAAGDWVERVARSPLVAVGEDGDPGLPLRLLGSRLHLDRYWRDERQVARDVLALAGADPPAYDAAVLGAGLQRLFPADDDAEQRAAAAAAVERRFAVIAGGPGTGKTTTVARVLALLHEQAAAAGAAPPLIALAAPTGKAAARLEEAVHGEAARLPVPEAVRALLLDSAASTLHRLLGWRPGSHSRFRHERTNRLPHDVVIVDETSMIGLSLMARLVEAVRPQARLVLVGDPGQLTSIEAGAVLGDVVGPAAAAAPADVATGARVAGAATAGAPGARPPVARGIVVLQRGHRFGGAIAGLAGAVRAGDAEGAMAVLVAGAGGTAATGAGDAGATGRVTWIDADPADRAAAGRLTPVKAGVVACSRAVTAAARGGDGRGALTELGAFRLLCAHRRGPHGVRAWTAIVEAWLAAEVDGFGEGGRWYVGRPLLVTENDPETRLYNGDTGVVVRAGPDRTRAVFERRGDVLALSPTRLGAVETVHAMTIHKAQGSQFTTAAVLLPPPGSRILTRELLYTAITRAREHLVVVGTAATIREAIARPVARASGLRDRLWSGSGDDVGDAGEQEGATDDVG